MGGKPRKKPEVNVLDQLAEEMVAYHRQAVLDRSNAYSPFKGKQFLGRLEATGHWLKRIDALRGEDNG